MLRLALPALLAAVLLLAGCLPSHQRKLSRDLFPADSLSRQVAEATPTDTLTVVWRAEAPREADLRHPLTLVWVGDRIVVADAQRGGLHVFSEDGTYREALPETYQYPFLGGARGDTVAVLSRGTGRLHLVTLASGRSAADFPAPEGRNPVPGFGPGGLFVKVADQASGAAVYRLDPSGGGVLERHALVEPYWRHLGVLRAWGDTLVSASGYRPVVDVLPSGRGASPLDTLALVGFDSPQLERSRLFTIGNIKEPPLLAPSVAGAGPLLFVLSARPGWVQIGAFGREDGGLRLRRHLVSPGAAVGRQHFVADFAARQRDGGYDLIVLENRPRPALVRYRWTPTEG
jgi:hypothetical protein